MTVKNILTKNNILKKETLKEELEKAKEVLEEELEKAKEVLEKIRINNISIYTKGFLKKGEGVIFKFKKILESLLNIKPEILDEKNSFIAENILDEIKKQRCILMGVIEFSKEKKISRKITKEELDFIGRAGSLINYSFRNILGKFDGKTKIFKRIIQEIDKDNIVIYGVAIKYNGEEIICRFHFNGELEMTFKNLKFDSIIINSSNEEIIFNNRIIIYNGLLRLGLFSIAYY